MEFSLSEETTLLKKNAARFLLGKCPASLIKEFIKDEKGFPVSIWKTMADLGWLGLVHEETYGGTGGSFFDLCVLFEEMGKVLLPSPFGSSVLSGFLLNESDDRQIKEKYLPRMISGETILTLALYDERGKIDFQEPKIEARETEDGEYILSGKRVLVPYAPIADGILMCSNVIGSRIKGPTIFIMPSTADGLTIIPLETLTEEKLFGVFFEKVKLSAEDIVDFSGRTNDVLKNLLEKALVCKCAEMVGGMERVVEMTVAYVKERQQFGRPLGSLQVIQHFCADMETYAKTSRLLTYQAAQFISEGVPCAKEVSMAKAWCSGAYKQCTWIAHQLHGAIGFTEEHDLHRYYKHAKATELAFGDSRYHRQQVAECMGY
ncbi:MAG: Acryloyl-CoA reductase (NADH) [Syntrophaceae bacterium PtaU1.Bin231]|nr:MAG: Acryloyl-CoA reductase (NADH) [Syntrophaceae bacterium PtaU1.Bin231]